ncbi:conserved hypothetical protein [Leishmania major strain Friedlin]|uniref:EF-hand domain-containing protein n=1 Tax=Leishmania major TaxID=5664 RepID=E9AEY5_LEIMA|nr:conserved hypothetical protein [Leishmania major strain Friedlin]CAG9582514.1 hypothetical_protein_-_conserved [Leishmania major strain Friedlin]CBZ12789.1 conserved hypothetical protein [Leishmania major strain Friedlin]|eukprot:XP_003722555.1 conserved hypothetical protein [Leishmania major strain Friedlin]
MAPVNVERVCSVFHLFAVNAADAAAARDEIREPYIPVCLLAAAAREMGYYPTPTTIHQFTETVPGAAAGAVTFAGFLQFCEDVAHTNQPGRSVIHRMVESMDPSGSGVISRCELFLILTSGSATISDGEIDAAMKLLDPTNSGSVRLSDLEAVLIDSCERQWSAFESRSSSKNQHQQKEQRQHESSVACATVAEKSHKPLHSTDITTAAVIPQAGSPAPHSGHMPAQPGDQKQHPKWRRRAFNRRRYEAPPSPPPATTATEGRRPQGQGQHWCPAAVSECDSFSQHTYTGSAGETVFPCHQRLCDRQDTFERTQTAMTVDVVVQLSPCQPTAEVRRRKFARNSSATASNFAAQTPRGPPRCAASATAAKEAPSDKGAEDSNELCPHHSNSADANGGARCNGGQGCESKQQKSSDAASDARGRSVLADADSPSAAEREWAMIDTIPTRKTSGSKCCIMF